MKYEGEPQKMIEKLKKSRKLLLEVFMQCPEKIWFKENKIGNWSVNDILLHIVGWDELLLKQAKQWLSGKEPKEYNTLVEDNYNQKYINDNKIKTKSEALLKLRNSTDILFEFLKSLKPKQIEYAIKNESLVDLDLYSHDMEHYEQLRKTLQQ